MVYNIRLPLVPSMEQFFSLLSFLWKMKVGLRDLQAVCMSVYPLPINFWIAEPNFMRLGT
jgi:hypothetical protein